MWPSEPPLWVATEEPQDLILQCKVHDKPDLKCKLCRKYKNSVNALARMARPDPTHAGLSLEMTNDTTFNVSGLLRERILASEYYRSLFALPTVEQIVAEIETYAYDAEPYVAGSRAAPSTFSCCLYKLMTMRPSEQQVLNLVESVNAFVRATGLLLLRYVLPAEKLWAWYEPYLLDDQEFQPGHDKAVTTIGEFAELLLAEARHAGQPLPRLPVKVKQLYGTQLLTLDEHRKRKVQNKRGLDRFSKDARVCACTE
ncbi:MAG: uncharacterized protein KVP18_003208 [Porospora cf. gigantea A]|uniref:uncharacterized protein n=1 Tax=Porospora cf. gigantea A TaxID=2853593 RepID=UPI003559DD67|nr:MAG: hypothetical protein KVP18_003208 [Porospora cf. gigantea A]